MVQVELETRDMQKRLSSVETCLGTCRIRYRLRDSSAIYALKYLFNVQNAHKTSWWSVGERFVVRTQGIFAKSKLICRLWIV